jgi:hypothetical protein
MAVGSLLVAGSAKARVLKDSSFLLFPYSLFNKASAYVIPSEARGTRAERGTCFFLTMLRATIAVTEMTATAIRASRSAVRASRAPPPVSAPR